jgi:hypothetical protein
MSSSIDEKKESIRVAMATLRTFTHSETTIAIEAPLETSAMKAMETVHTVFLEGFRDSGDSKGEFVDDDDFFNEIFAYNVAQVMIDVIQQADNDSPPPLLYAWTFGISLVFGHTLSSNELQDKLHVCFNLIDVLGDFVNPSNGHDSYLTFFCYLVLCTWAHQKFLRSI